jgi:hypothetical protein
VTGEPGTPAGASRRGRFALKPGIPWKGENLPLGLDFGELIEGTENGFLRPMCPISVPDTLSGPKITGADMIVVRDTTVRPIKYDDSAGARDDDFMRPQRILDKQSYLDP